MVGTWSGWRDMEGIGGHGVEGPGRTWRDWREGKGAVGHGTQGGPALEAHGGDAEGTE